MRSIFKTFELRSEKNGPDGDDAVAADDDDAIDDGPDDDDIYIMMSVCLFVCNEKSSLPFGFHGFSR